MFGWQYYLSYTVAAIRWTLHMVCCQATSWDAGRIEADFSLPSGCVSGVWCLGLGLYKDYFVHVVCYVSAVLYLVSCVSALLVGCTIVLEGVV